MIFCTASSHICLINYKTLGIVKKWYIYLEAYSLKLDVSNKEYICIYLGYCFNSKNFETLINPLNGVLIE